MDKLISLCARTEQTIHVGVGKDNVLRLELMDDELSEKSGFVSIKLCSPYRDEDEKAYLEAEKEVGHVHVIKGNKGEWAVDMQSNSKARLEGMLDAERMDMERCPLRHLSERENSIVAEVTMSDAARKRAALEQELGISFDTSTSDEKKPSSTKDKNLGKEEPKPKLDTGMKDIGTEPKGKNSQDKKESEEKDNPKKRNEPLKNKEKLIINERRDTEKRIEKAIKELHDGLRKDKSMQSHKAPVTVMVDKYMVSLCPPNAHNDTAYYKIDDRYAGNYMRSYNNPKITMDYISRHNLLDNPVNSIPDKFTAAQIEGCVAKGIVYDANHHTNDVPAYMASLEKDVNVHNIVNYIKSDIGKYPIQDAAETMHEVYKIFQRMDINDSLKDSKAAVIYREAYNDFMNKDELTHPGEFKVEEVDYIGSDGTLYDKDGKLFVAKDGHITLDNCEASAKELLIQMRAEEVGPRGEEPEIINKKDLTDQVAQPVQENTDEEIDKTDWLNSYNGEPTEEELPFNIGDEDGILPFDDQSGMGPDFGLQSELDFGDSIGNVDDR